MTTATPPTTIPPTIIIIDSDATAARELSTLLLDRAPDKKSSPTLLVYPTTKSAAKTLESEHIDWLFIRINDWDDYQRIVFLDTRLHTHIHVSTRVVFLSGRLEKCTEHLPATLDAHLQPPYSAARLGKIFKRLTAPDFTPQPLDFFFLKCQARQTPIRYNDLYQVHLLGRELWIETRDKEYRIYGSMVAFAARLPIPLTYIRRGWLVNESYDPDPPKLKIDQPFLAPPK